MWRSAFIRALSMGMRPSLAKSRRVGVVVEGAGHKDVEARVPRLAGRGHQVGLVHRAELRAYEDARAPLLVPSR